MGSLKPWHWVVIAVVILILFGAGKLQGFTRSLMQSLHIIKAEAKSLKDDAPAQQPAQPAPAEIAASQPPVNPVSTAQPPGVPQAQPYGVQQQTVTPPPTAAAPIVAPVLPPEQPGSTPPSHS